MENNYFFIKKYISQSTEATATLQKQSTEYKTQSKKKDVLVIFILLQETKNSNLFDKNCAQENVKCHNLT